MAIVMRGDLEVALSAYSVLPYRRLGGIVVTDTTVP